MSTLLPPGSSRTWWAGALRSLSRPRRTTNSGPKKLAQVMNHVVLADPNHVQARALLADTYEQLGYQAESGPWRNFYLSGALELRQAMPSGSSARMSEDVVRGIPLENMFQALATRLNGPKAAERCFAFNLVFTDIDENYLMTVDITGWSRLREIRVIMID